MTRRSLLGASLGLLVTAALLVGGAEILSDRSRGTPFQPAPCAPGESGCASARAEAFGGPGIVPAAEICRTVAYLCSGLDTSDRITLRRWVDFEGTLVVHVPRPAHEDRAEATRLQRAASAGVRAWNGHPFPILVDERGFREADISVQWAPALGGRQLGLTETVWVPGDGLRVRGLHLATRPSVGSSAPLSPDQVRLTAAHEMGHALGLPHSDEPRDVMYPTNTSSSLTARDYRTLEALYALDDGLEIVR